MRIKIGILGVLAFLAGAVALPPEAAAQTPSVRFMRPALVQDFSAQTRRKPRRARVLVYPQQPAAWSYPRPGDVSYPGPGATRDCQAFYVTENRPSGTVITPQMRCRWVR